MKTSRCDGRIWGGQLIYGGCFRSISIPADIKLGLLFWWWLYFFGQSHRTTSLTSRYSNQRVGRIYTSFFKTTSSPYLCWINRTLFFFKGFSSFCPDSMLPLKAAPGQFGPEARTPGLQVWRVEKMKAVPLDPAEVGSFYNGDSYLVLDNRGEMGADIHMWIGEIGATSGF